MHINNVVSVRFRQIAKLLNNLTRALSKIIKRIRSVIRDKLKTMENVNVYEIHHGKCTLQLKMTDQGQISI